jgi:hypothetical protein
VTNGRVGLASTTVGEGHRTTRRHIARKGASGSGTGETAGGSGRRRRRDTRGREQRREGRQPQERRRCSACGVHRPGRATARAGSGTPAVKERRCMTRSNHCPTRDDRGKAVVAAGTGGKPQGRVRPSRHASRTHRLASTAEAKRGERAAWRDGPQRRSGIVRMPAAPDSAARPANAGGGHEPQERRLGRACVRTARTCSRSTARRLYGRESRPGRRRRMIRGRRSGARSRTGRRVGR